MHLNILKKKSLSSILGAFKKAQEELMVFVSQTDEEIKALEIKLKNVRASQIEAEAEKAQAEKSLAKIKEITGE
jgi:hypothetical protein